MKTKVKNDISFYLESEVRECLISGLDIPTLDIWDNRHTFKNFIELEACKQFYCSLKDKCPRFIYKFADQTYCLIRRLKDCRLAIPLNTGFADTLGLGPWISYNEECQFDVEEMELTRSIWNTNRMNIHYPIKDKDTIILKASWNYMSGRFIKGSLANIGDCSLKNRCEFFQNHTENPEKDKCFFIVLNENINEWICPFTSFNTNKLLYSKIAILKNNIQKFRLIKEIIV